MAVQFPEAAHYVDTYDHHGLLGPLSVLLLAIPMAIGRWTFRSFERVRNAHDASINLFIRLIEAKDVYTARHTERVAKYAGYIAQALQPISLGPRPKELEKIFDTTRVIFERMLRFLKPGVTFGAVAKFCEMRQPARPPSIVACAGSKR